MAQAFGLADVDDLAFGVLVEVHAGGGRDGADFLLEIHRGGSILLDDFVVCLGARVVAAAVVELRSTRTLRLRSGQAYEGACPHTVRGSLRNCSDHINFPHSSRSWKQRVYAVGVSKPCGMSRLRCVNRPIHSWHGSCSGTSRLDSPPRIGERQGAEVLQVRFCRHEI